MILDPIYPEILSVKIIDKATPQMLEAYSADLNKHVSLGLITCNQDDPTYVALDEATKHAEVDVIYAKSFYAGSKHSSGKLSGEILGVIAAKNPDEIKEGLKALTNCLTHDACFYKADDKGEIAIFPHVISSVGHYLSKLAGIDPGSSMAYLIAPPMEATIGMDAALKAAEVRAVKIFPPPTETNFCGIWLTGTLTDCEAAAEAFVKAVIQVSLAPIHQLEGVIFFPPPLG